MADLLAEMRNGWNFLVIPGGETTAQIHHAQLDAGLLQVVEQHGHLANGRLMRFGPGLLAAGVE